jgi:hypothetical protein
MRTPRSLIKAVLGIGIVFIALMAAQAASAQMIPTPGETPEEVKEWTYYISFGVIGITLLVVVGLGVVYMVFSRRFFGKEELPQVPQRRRQPQFAGAAAPPVAAPRAPSAAGPAAPADSAPAQAPPGPATPTPARTAPTAAEPEAEGAARAQQAAAAAAPAPARPAEHVEPDQETYDRVLQEQLDKGTDRRVAEGRAKAAAVRAARTGGATAEKPEPGAPPPGTAAAEAEAKAAEAAVPVSEKPAATEEGAGPAAGKGEEESKAEAEASAEAQAKVKEPEVVEPPAPGAEAEEAPAKVVAPQPQAEERAAEPAEQPKPTVPAGADQETYERILQEQLDKGLARPIAEGRARAAAIKAARERAGAG